MSRTDVYSAVDAEREYQEKRWGTAFDDKNTANDWAAYIGQYLGDRVVKMGLTAEQQRAGMIKVAALAIAAIESFDRNNGFPPRHYDA